MQTSIIKYSDFLKAKRFDAEYFKPEFLEIEEKINSLKYLTVKDISHDNVVYGTTPKDGEFVKEGVPFIKSEVLKHKIIFDENDLVYCTPEFHKKNKKSEVCENDILFSAVGATIGEVAIVKDIKKSNTNQNIARVRVINDNILPDFVFIYFLSKFGNKQLERYKTGNAQPYLNSLQIKSFKVPLLPKSFQLQIEKIVKQVYQNQSQSKKLYKEAERLLLEELGLVDYKPKHKLTFTATKSEVDEAGRFDAEYFQPKYAEIIEKIENYKNGWEYLDSVIENYSTGFPFKSSTYTKDGIYLIRINNIVNGRLDLSNASKIPYKDKNLSKKDITKENDILISMSGTIGSACKVPKDIVAVINQRIFRFTPKNYNEEVLVLFINSVLGNLQLNRIGTGGVQTNISSNDIKKIKIPLISSKTQKQIAKKIQESYKLRKESKNLLERAKRMVEEEIEKI